MDPVTIAALIGAATSAVQGIAGGFQLAKANKLEKQYPRPTATKSQSIQDLQGYAYGRMLDQDVPGGEIYRNEIAGATASGLKAASQMGSGAEAYGMLDRLVLGQQKQYSQLAAKAAEQRYAAEGDYMNILQGPVYQEERRVDYWNKEMPYLQAAEAARALRESGSQNIMSGVKNVAGVATSTLNADILSSLMGKGEGAGFSMDEDTMNALIAKITGANQKTLNVPKFGINQ